MKIELITKDDNGTRIDPPRLIIEDGNHLYWPQTSPNGWVWDVDIDAVVEGKDNDN